MLRLIKPVIAGAALTLAVVASAAWAASPAAASSFGQHVHTCAQQVGFSAEHNPGMHRGAAGWDGMPCTG